MRGAAVLLAALLLACACSGPLPTQFAEATLYVVRLDGRRLEEVSTAGLRGVPLDPGLLGAVLARAQPAEQPVLLKGRGDLLEARTPEGRVVRMEVCLYGAWHRRLIGVAGYDWRVVSEADAPAWIAETDRAARLWRDG